MQDVVFTSLTSERVVQSKLSVIVTEECVVIPSFSRQPNTVLSLGAISQIKVVKTHHPSLLVISAGSLLLAAAALSSKDGAGMGIPIGIVGIGFLVTFLASQKARVVFMDGLEATQTINGSFAEVADLVAAVEVSRRNLMTTSSEKIMVPGVFTRANQWITGLLSSRIRTSIL